MTINYCDYENGNDSTGDGTHGNPYKLIFQASSGLTGDDEVRVAKGPDDSDLSGTLAFVDESTSITTSVDLTGELIIGDFIYKTGESDNINEVKSLTSSVLTLYKLYSGTTENVAGKKLGIICTGSASSGERVQQVGSSGTSDVSRLKISGGWDLSTQQRAGRTYFQQINPTYWQKMGYGLFVTNRTFLDIEYLGFLRYYTGLQFSNMHHNNMNYLVSLNNGYYGLYHSTIGYKNIFNHLHCSGNIQSGIRLLDSHSQIFNSPKCYGNDVAGIDLNASNFNIINSPTCKFNASQGGINISGSSVNNVINSPVCTSNNYGISCAWFGNTEIYNYSGINNTIDNVGIQIQAYDNENPILKIQHFNIEGDNRCYYLYGITYRDTAEARSTQCLRFAPISDTYYIMHNFNFTALNNIEKIISFYIKDDATFDGDVQAALYFMGENITGWTEIPTTTSYVRNSLIANAANITENGILKLKIKVRGTTGNVYVDDLGVI